MNQNVDSDPQNKQKEESKGFSWTDMSKKLISGLIPSNKKDQDSANSNNNIVVQEKRADDSRIEARADVSNASQLQLLGLHNLDISVDNKKSETSETNRLRAKTKHQGDQGDISLIHMETINNTSTFSQRNPGKSPTSSKTQITETAHNQKPQEIVNHTANIRFCLKLFMSMMILALSALFLTYPYTVKQLGISLNPFADGLASGIALTMIINRLISNDSDILAKYEGLWKMHVFCVIQLTAITTITSYILSTFSAPNPMWLTLIKSVLILWTMMLYSIYLKNQRNREKSKQDIGNQNKKTGGFFNVKIYKNFMEDVAKSSKELVLKTESREGELKNDKNVFLGKNTSQGRGEKHEETKSDRRFLKGRHNIVNMVTFQSGVVFSIMITIPVLQFTACIGIYEVFLLLWTRWKPGSFFVAASYPLVVGFFKLIMHALNTRYEMRMSEFIEFASIIFASLPYRFFYFAFDNYGHALLLIFIRLLYKMTVYIVYGSKIRYWHEKCFNRKPPTEPSLQKKLSNQAVDQSKQSPTSKNPTSKTPTFKNQAIGNETNIVATWSPEANKPATWTNIELPNLTAGDSVPSASRINKRFSKAAKRGIAEKARALEYENKHRYDNDYRIMYLKFFLLQTVDILDLIAEVISMVTMRAVNKTNYYSQYTWAQLSMVTVWNAIELALNLLLMVLFAFIWRKSEVLSEFQREVRPLEFLRENFKVSLGLQAIVFFSLYYIVSNLFSSANLDISDVMNRS